MNKLGLIAFTLGTLTAFATPVLAQDDTAAYAPAPIDYSAAPPMPTNNPPAPPPSTDYSHGIPIGGGVSIGGGLNPVPNVTVTKTFK